MHRTPVGIRARTPYGCSSCSRTKRHPRQRFDRRRNARVNADPGAPRAAVSHWRSRTGCELRARVRGCSDRRDLPVVMAIGMNGGAAWIAGWAGAGVATHEALCAGRGRRREDRGGNAPIELPRAGASPTLPSST